MFMYILEGSRYKLWVIREANTVVSVMSHFVLQPTALSKLFPKT